METVVTTGVRPEATPVVARTAVPTTAESGTPTKHRRAPTRRGTSLLRVGVRARALQGRWGDGHRVVHPWLGRSRAWARTTAARRGTRKSRSRDGFPLINRASWC